MRRPSLPDVLWFILSRGKREWSDWEIEMGLGEEWVRYYADGGMWHH